MTQCACAEKNLYISTGMCINVQVQNSYVPVFPMEDRPYDLVIFGASGFTGQYVVNEVARTVEGEGLRWAVAGRSVAKLVQTIRDACDWTGQIYF